jgi:arsenate reductase (glutaredoxin)
VEPDVPSGLAVFRTKPDGDIGLHRCNLSPASTHRGRMLKMYTLSNCDTCRAATKWLRGRAIAFQEIPIREQPPSVAEVRSALAARGGNLRALFNTSGREYRAQKFGEKLDGMSEADAIAALAGNGSLVKRPLLIGKDVALVGFDEAEWGRAVG